MGADLRSVDPNELRDVARAIEATGRHAGYVTLLRTWAQCAADAIADPDYFPRACGPYPYGPGQSPIFDAGPAPIVTPTPAQDDALRQYREILAVDLRVAGVPAQDAVEQALRHTGLETEANALRQRRDRLFELVTGRALAEVRRAPSHEAAEAYISSANNLQRFGYVARPGYIGRDMSGEVRTAIALRKAVLAGRNLRCAFRAGCRVRVDGDTEAVVTLPVGTLVTLLEPLDAVIGPLAPEGAAVRVAFDDVGGSGYSSSGYVLARALDRNERAVYRNERAVYGRA